MVPAMLRGRERWTSTPLVWSSSMGLRKRLSPHNDPLGSCTLEDWSNMGSLTSGTTVPAGVFAQRGRRGGITVMAVQVQLHNYWQTVAEKFGPCVGDHQ